VYPIAEVMADDWGRQRNGRVVVGVSGTGSGMARFCRGEIDIATASRPIKNSERAACAAAGIGWVELPVAWDGIVVAVHPETTWVDGLTLEDLQRIWSSDSAGQVMLWSDVRPTWPNQPLRLFGPGVESGTWEYFAHDVIQDEVGTRSDYLASEDDNLLVQGVGGTPGGLGFFGYAYWRANRDRVRALAFVSPDGTAVLPDTESIGTGAYAPLARPLFVYVSSASLARPAVHDFMSHWLDAPDELLLEAGFVPFDRETYTLIRQRLVEGI
jgi:phosphate transport system substrate-binding protein